MDNKSNLEPSKESFGKLLEVIIKLRSPEGCPWDKAQTLITLIPNLFEETFECIDAINKNDDDNTMEEIGDLYLLVVMLSYVLEQTTKYKVSDVLDTITEKLIRRHPHVFSDKKVNNVNDVLDLWQDIKVNVEGREKKDSILDSIPLSFPPLERAYKIQKKVSKVGFDWNNSKDIINKIKEEFGELEEELKNKNQTMAEGEMGDFLFSIVNLSRFLGIDPSLALHKTNQKFAKRFKFVENGIKKTGKGLKDSSLEEMDRYWEKAKQFDEY